MQYTDRIAETAVFVLEVIRSHRISATFLIMGIMLLLAGIGMNTYNIKSSFLYRPGRGGIKGGNSKMAGILDRMTSIQPLRMLREDIKLQLSMGQLEAERVKLCSNLILLGLVFLSVLNIFLLRNVGQLWYAKLLLFAISIFLPYYVLTLGFDLYKHYMSRHIPQMIDEFRSAFIKHRKVKPALKECCSHIDKSLARVMLRTAEAPYIEDNLMQLRDNFNNTWFNVFVALIINYKSNGGELIDQLYRLNKTMTRYNNIEKKKNKRLIWYELFAVAASIFSIPAIFWLNTAILGNDVGVLIDARSNVIISRIIGYSLLSLVVVRVLRRM